MQDLGNDERTSLDKMTHISASWSHEDQVYIILDPSFPLCPPKLTSGYLGIVEMSFKEHYIF